MNDPRTVLELLGPVLPLALGLGLCAWAARSRALDGRQRLLAAGLMGVAALSAATVLVLTASEPLDDRWIDTARQRYEALWERLDSSSLLSARDLSTIDLETADSVATFGLLDALGSRTGVSLFLIAPDRRVVAWGGPGLLHPPESMALPSTGPAFYSGFAAVTAASIRRVGRQDEPWLLLAGASYSTHRLPFASPAGGSRENYRWTMVRAGSRPIADTTRIDVEGRPAMSVRLAADFPRYGQPRAVFFLRAAWALLGVALLLVSLRSSSRPPGRAGRVLRTWPAVLALPALGIALGADPIALTLLGATGVVAGASARRLGILAAPPWWALLPVGTIGVLIVLAHRLEKVWGPIGLGETLLAGPRESLLRVTVVLLVLIGILPVLGASRGGRRPGFNWAAGLAACALAVASVGAPRAGLVVLAAASVLLVDALRARRDPRSALDVALIVGVAALIGSSAWELGYRSLLARYLERDVAPVLGPPTAEERRDLDDRVREYFESVDLLEIVPADPVDLDETDLAYALWRDSPLASRGWLSATAVLVDSGPAVSTFGFGVPLDPWGALDPAPELWQALDIPGWEEALLEGEVELAYLGESVGRVRYALLPRPGFRLQSEPIDQLASRLVEGGLGSRLPIQEVIEPAEFAVYERRPRATIGSRTAPALPVGSLSEPSFRIRSEEGRLRGWTFDAGSATEVVYLASPGPLQAIERAATQTVGTLLLLALVGTFVWLASGFSFEAVRRAWQRIYHSYSKKLLVIYGGLLLVPLLALSLGLLGVLGERIGRSQEEAAETALEAAQHVLGEYMLSLEPGFGVDTALDDPLLDWLSRVIGHEVNLYWGSTLYASSNPELFTSGFLPSRIPGEVYSELALQSASRASRLRRANRESYVELYAPLRIPGVRSQETLFLSIPLLAQQQQTDRSIAELRTRAVLVASLLLVAVIVVASRLSRNFTRPLMELIAGTEAIAAGADSVPLDPTELELAALARAINDMAGKISDARERLLREKQVVETMIQNITAGVVSLDAERRVLLRNRVAGELLGLEIGDPLRDVVERRDAPRPLAAFLASAGDEPAQETMTLRFSDGEEREWSVVWVPLPGGGEPTSLLVVEDVSEVLRGQRLQAWAEMARMIAHEIKNPLTPIRLSAEHMTEVRGSSPETFDEVFERCARNILRQVDELQSIAADFSTYSRIPQVNRAPADLVELVGEVVESYLVAPPPGIELSFRPSTDACRIEVDAKLFTRALRNLIENALNASAGEGEIVVGLALTGKVVAITVADRGPGVDEETLARMFDPYFSTESGGTGLGLPISRSIVEQHGGTLTAANRDGGGLRATIRLPLDGADTEPHDPGLS